MHLQERLEELLTLPLHGRRDSVVYVQMWEKSNTLGTFNGFELHK